MAINKSYWQYNKTIRANLGEKEKHLRYEIDMFRKTCRGFINWGLLSQFEKNLLVESFAIHTRILVDFFYPKKRYKNDIVAQDFLKGKAWRRPKITQTLYDAREKANKQLAHLSAWRIKIEKDGKKDWNVPNISKDIETLIKDFGNAISKKF